MIDLRSDTLTLPSQEMLRSVQHVNLGDDGRTNKFGRGEDPTVNKLEDLAAQTTGKEAALLFPTGTMANHAALLSFCKRGARIAIESHMHMYISEKIAFDKDYFGIEPHFYHVNEGKHSNAYSIQTLLQNKPIDLVCVENTHNYYGGICTSITELNQIRSLINKKGIPLYMDGARIFNAAIALDSSVKSLCEPVDAVMFCLSKGLGAPIGSVLCGSKKLIEKARKIRKLLGGTMRQAGIVAANGLIALEESNINRLKVDHKNAKSLASGIINRQLLDLNPSNINSNIVSIDLTKAGWSPDAFAKHLKKKGVLSKVMPSSKIRFVTYNGIHASDITKAIKRINATIQDFEGS